MRCKSSFLIKRAVASAFDLSYFYRDHLGFYETGALAQKAHRRGRLCHTGIVRFSVSSKLRFRSRTDNRETEEQISGSGKESKSGPPVCC